VVGNPANTNCLTCVKSAPSLPATNFSCLTRLDHNRATAQVSPAHPKSLSSLQHLQSSQVALKLGVKPSAVRNVIIWGNHSSTQFPDVSHAAVCRGTDCQQVYAAVNDDAWLKGDFIKVKFMHKTICDKLVG